MANPVTITQNAICCRFPLDRAFWTPRKQKKIVLLPVRVVVQLLKDSNKSQQLLGRIKAAGETG